jgi:hypothetical protein
MRDAHSQTVRKKNRETARRLLACNQQDSLIKGIKLLGFTDFRVYLVSLNKLELAGKQLRAKGIELSKLPSDVLIQAYRTVSQKNGYVYPPIKPQIANSKLGNTNGTKISASNAYGICEMCFLNNCDECGEFGEANTQLEQPSNDKGGSGGNPCRTNAAAKRQNAMETESSSLLKALLACVTTGAGAGTTACSATVASIIGAPISPGVGVGVGCLVFIGCDAWVLYDHELAINRIELEYQGSINSCAN